MTEAQLWVLAASAAVCVVALAIRTVVALQALTRGTRRHALRQFREHGRVIVDLLETESGRRTLAMFVLQEAALAGALDELRESLLGAESVKKVVDEFSKASSRWFDRWIRKGKKIPDFIWRTIFPKINEPVRHYLGGGASS